MIGRLAGRLIQRGADHVMLDVGGVGYIVHVSDRTLAALPPVGQAAALWTELIVREDLLQLYGFLTPVEKEWHRLLMTVQGVGAKGALAILGTLGEAGLARAIGIGDWAAVKAAPGVGPKIAQRVVLELKAKAPAIMAMGGVVDPPVIDPTPAPVELVAPAPSRTRAPSAATAQAAAQAEAQAQALSALTNLGYAPGEAASAVATAAAGAPGSATPDLIRLALRALAPKG
jgi:Holliday junction DNA helicase RuvA